MYNININYKDNALGIIIFPKNHKQHYNPVPLKLYFIHISFQSYNKILHTEPK